MAAKNLFAAGVYFTLQGKENAGAKARMVAMNSARIPESLHRKIVTIFIPENRKADFQQRAFKVTLSIGANAEFMNLIDPSLS